MKFSLLLIVIFVLFAQTNSSKVASFELQVKQPSKCIWPPNNLFSTFANVTTEIFNLLDLPSTCTLNSLTVNCTSNQPDNMKGDGKLVGDCFYNASIDTICVRAECTKKDRVYAVNLTVNYTCGYLSNVTNATWNVIVPVDGRNSCPRTQTKNTVCPFSFHGNNNNKNNGKNDDNNNNNHDNNENNDNHDNDNNGNHDNDNNGNHNNNNGGKHYKRNNKNKNDNDNDNDSPDKKTVVGTADVNGTCSGNSPVLSSEDLCNTSYVDQLVECLVQAGSESNISEFNATYIHKKCVINFTVTPALTTREFDCFLRNATESGCLPAGTVLEFEKTKGDYKKRAIFGASQNPEESYQISFMDSGTSHGTVVVSSVAFLLSLLLCIWY